MKILIPLAGMLLVASCKKDDGAAPLDLTSQAYFDVNAQPLGAYGPNPGENLRQETWADWERALFADLDTVDLPQSAADTVRFLGCWPNPARSRQVYGGQGNGAVALKIVIVDRNRRPVFKSAITGTNNPLLEVDRSAWPGTDSLYRVYYSFSTRSKPHFRTVHANVTFSKP